MFGAKSKWLLILLGTCIWSLVMVKSGWLYSYGLGFWGANGHDGVWHLALIEGLSRTDWQMPIFAGEAIKNYHIGFDVVVAVIHRVTGLSSSLLYFQLIPPIMALLIGWVTYQFVLTWTKSKSAAGWALFFVYFGGGWGWLVGHGESTFWSTQAISTLINPPFALSLVALLAGLLALQRQKWLLAGLIFGLCFQVKVYGGLLAWTGLFAAGLWTHQKDVWKAWIVTTLIGGGLLALTTGSASLIVWQPGWFLETMMGLSDRLNWPRYYSAMTNYRLSDNWIKLIPAYGVALVIFWVGNLGTRLVAVWHFAQVRRFKDFSWEEVFMGTVILVGGFVPMLFLQSGTPWNTIQFFYYSLFFSGLLAASAMTRIKYRLLAILIVVLTLPTTWQALPHYLPDRPPAKLSLEEVEALQFLATQSQGVVLTYPYDATAARLAQIDPPRPLYLYDSTAYVSAYGKHPVYLEDEVNLNITGYAWQDRRQKSQDLFAMTDSAQAMQFLKDNKIEYIYMADIDNLRPILSESQLGMENIFENPQVAIWASVDR